MEALVGYAGNNSIRGFLKEFSSPSVHSEAVGIFHFIALKS